MAFDFSSDEPATGSIPEPIRAVSPPLNMQPRPPFFLKFHPQRWMIVDGELLPQLGQLAVDPGCNGVTAAGDPIPARIAAEQRGWTVLPWSVIPDGYVRVHQVRAGKAHLTRWQRPKMVGNKVIFRIDRAGYHEFLRGLLRAGIIPPPDPDLIEGMIATKQKQIERNEGSAATDPRAARRVNRDRQQLAELQAAADAARSTDV